ncbi:MAG: excinuclease ABC subunit UvrA, partial [Fibrobacter sp.]|nr:excinuclease ABC subunit UvrA [Fibrobacter sp.]
MNNEKIIIREAKTHNLKNLSIDIPKHKLVVFTGVSGSGKSSLLFDTIYTEAERQLIETFSTFARARLPKLSRPDVEEIQNLSTAIIIDQKRMGSNLRSTVGTATEVNTYLRLLYSRFGQPFIGPSFFFSFNHPDGMCQHCQGLGKLVKVDLNLLLDKEKSLREGAIVHPECKVGGFLWRELLSMDLFDVDKPLKDFSEEELNKLLYTEPVPVEKKHGAGTYMKNFEGIARRLERITIERAEDELPDGEKNAYKKYFLYKSCDFCRGTRINEQALGVKINGVSIGDLCEMELTDTLSFLREIENPQAHAVKRKAENILEHLVDIGVGYLSLDRPVSTLSGGESQRVKMARQLDCTLTDLMYIMDEPTIGLHPRDTGRMLAIMKKLLNTGNSVFVVEHDPDVIREAEWIVDIGPGAGKDGGSLVYSGPIEGLKSSDGTTSRYLYRMPPVKYERKKPLDFIPVTGLNVHNLKNIHTRIPRGVLTCITGVAGSGKSTLINHCFVPEHPEAIVIDQSPIGRSSRGNPATYIGIFDLIRKEFSSQTGENASLFSFNSKGACPKCNGQGFVSLELHFLDAVKTVCDECGGTRFQQSVLDLKYKGFSIADALEMTVDGAIGVFPHKEINKRLKVLSEVGLGYLKIGQTLSSLSGGESQRLKLASELHKSGNIYIMDEPTTGLHLSDIERLYGII